jgi:hypothetical protein
MPLHRDIHWIGRQWAVTGHGMQLIDQKLQGFFDIEASRLWDFDLIEAMHAKEWLNTADFEKALGLARARNPQSAGVAAPSVEVTRTPAVEPVAPIAEVAKPIAPKPETPKAEPPRVEPPRVAAPGIETPRVETPRVETPRVETARAESPKLEKPAPIEPLRAATDVTKDLAVVPARHEPPPEAPKAVEPPQAIAAQAPVIATPAAAEPPKPPPTLLQMRYEGRARFVRPWRVVARKL